jgi:hypothetical protein
MAKSLKQGLGTPLVEGFGLCPSICGKAMLRRGYSILLRLCRRTHLNQNGGKAARMSWRWPEKYNFSANRAAEPQEKIDPILPDHDKKSLPFRKNVHYYRSNFQQERKRQ